MIPKADIIRSLLIALGLGSGNTSAQWAVFVGIMPVKPDNAITVYDTAGKQDGRLQASGEQIMHPGIQVRIRGLNYVDSYGKAQEIALALDAQYRIDVTVGAETFTVQNISRQGDILPMGIEEEGDKRWWNFSINAILTLEP